MAARGRPAARSSLSFCPQPFHLQYRVASMTASLRLAAFAFLAALTAWPALTLRPAQASEPFPFGSELMLDAAPMRGSKRVPMIQIEDSGSASIHLWWSSPKAPGTGGDGT